MSNPEYVLDEPYTSLLTAVRGIIALCFSHELLERQKQFVRFNPEYQPVEDGVLVTLGAQQQNDGSFQHTYIGNIRQIRAKSRIETGAVLGEHVTLLLRCVVGEGAVIEPYATLEHNALIGANTVVEHGAKVLVGASVGTDAVIGTGAEINYDACVADREKVLPEQIVHE